MIYLDNAATSWPKPKSVYTTMDTFLRTKGGIPGRGGHSLAVAGMQVIEETRILIARLINAPDMKRIVFTLNCTDALNLGLKGLLQPGDHVITSAIEHNSVIRTLSKLERTGVGVTRVLPAEKGGVVSPRDIEKSILPETRLIVINHASNVTGIVQPIEEYGEVAARHNILFMVDAAQTAGKHPIDVQTAIIDFLAASGHKGLFGPPGTGFLCIGERVNLDSISEGGTGSFSENEEQPEVLPDKFESGTLNSVSISGLGAGVKFIFTEGIEKIYAHEKLLTNQLIEGLSKIPEVTIYAANDTSRQSPVFSITIGGLDPGDVGAILDQAFDIKVRTGLHCSPVTHQTIGTLPKGTIRLS